MTDPKSAFEKPSQPASPDPGRLPNAAYHSVLTGQPALVTGANSGIGRATAIGLARARADVVVNYVVHPEADKEVVHEIELLGRRAIALKAAVSKEDEVDRMFAQAIGHFGTLHVVVSNAGLQRDAAFTEMTLEQWNTVIGVNLPCRLDIRKAMEAHSGASQGQREAPSVEVCCWASLQERAFRVFCFEPPTEQQSSFSVALLDKRRGAAAIFA